MNCFISALWLTPNPLDIFNDTQVERAFYSKTKDRYDMNFYFLIMFLGATVTGNQEFQDKANFCARTARLNIL